MTDMNCQQNPEIEVKYSQQLQFFLVSVFSYRSQPYLQIFEQCGSS